MCYVIVIEIYLLEVNGVVFIVQGLEQGLCVVGYEIDFVCFCQFIEVLDLVFGILLVFGVVLFCYFGLCFGLLVLIWLGCYWQNQCFDVVYIVIEGLFGWLVLCIVCCFGILVVSGFYICFDEYLFDYGVVWLQVVVMCWMCCFYNQVDVILVLICELQQFFGEQGFECVCLLVCVVDSQQFDLGWCDFVLCEEWGVDGNGLVVIYVGCIVVEKNFGLVVKVFCCLQQIWFKVCFVWVGDGLVCEKLVYENFDFIFCGIQCGDVLVCYFVSGDLFLFFSCSEIFGNVILESMVSGVVIVVFDYGVVCEYLCNGENGVVVDSDEQFIEVVV